jgi:hypothetical protein
MRRNNPQDIDFIERYLIHEAETKYKAMKDAERKSKSHKSRRR